MKKFSHRFRVAAPIEKVRAFHQDTRALKRLTPPPLWVQFHSVEPLAENSRTSFTLWLGPIPINWEAIHTNVTEQGFTDTQLKGPNKSWVHHHHFTSIDAQTTEVIDEVYATFSEGVVWGLVSRLMWLGLPLLFAFRTRQTRKFIQ